MDVGRGAQGTVQELRLWVWVLSEPESCPQQRGVGLVSGFVDSLLSVDSGLSLVLVGLLVFAEDALFVGFVIPGETAAVLGGVVASRGEVQLGSMMALVVCAAVIGDSVGYEVGKHVGPKLLDTR